MANTSNLKTIVETWYRETLQKTNPQYDFPLGRKVKLVWGGDFECDAVLKLDNEIKEVHCLSTSDYKTITGKGGNGKVQKIKADALMLLGIQCSKKILAFTGNSMFVKIKQEQDSGRFPKEINLVFVDIQNNQELKDIINKVKKDAIEEMI
jgi:hypothetical protein